MMGGRGSRLSQILNSSVQFGEAQVVEELLQAILDANASIVGNAGVKGARDRIEGQLRELDFQQRSLSPSIAIVGGTSLDGVGEAGKRQMLRSILERLQLLIDEHDPQQGLGYNNLLFMATELLLLKQEIDDYPLLLVEEPEAHLHPQLQMKFLKALRSSIGSGSDHRLQSVLTTHSPNLASKAPLDSVILMESGKAFPLRRGRTALDEPDYIFLEKFLDVTKANLFFAKGVLLVEGSGENILLPTIADLLGLPLEDFGVSIVNVGSKAYARFARIFRRNGLDAPAESAEWLGTKVVCISDLDLWREKAKIDPANPHGFVAWKDGNKHYWLSHYPTEAALEDRKAAMRREAAQNVRVELSDHWTFEYALIRSGLGPEVSEALGRTQTEFDALPVDDEERAIALYKEIATISGAKTLVAYALAVILTRVYGPVVSTAIAGETPEDVVARKAADQVTSMQRRADLRSRLPLYLINALDYVTSGPAAVGDVAGDPADVHPAH